MATSKQQLMRESYVPGMTSGDLVNAVESAGGAVSRRYADTFVLREESRYHQRQVVQLQESVVRLEQSLMDGGWERMLRAAEMEFSTHGRQTLIALARVMRLKNPVIRRGVEIQRLYVWARDASMTAVDEQVNSVIQAFLDDERNQAVLTSHQAKGEREEALQTDGNMFIRLFVNPLNGHVRIRCIDAGEVTEIVTNPEDKDEPWFYKRVYNVQGLDGKLEQVTEYYPDINYTPAQQNAPAGWSVVWDSPVYHVAVNKVGRYGTPEFYAAIDWARAYKAFLEDLATVWRSLSAFAWNMTVPGGSKGISTAKTQLNTTMGVGTPERNPPPAAGSMFIAGQDGASLNPIKTSGATTSAEDGRRLLLMAISVFGFPETFYGDVSVGTLATAKSLDRPTELKIIDRQTLWRGVFSRLFRFVLLWAVKAPQGSLRSLGKLVTEDVDNERTERVEWNKTVDATVNIDFPSIVEEDVAPLISTLIDVATLRGGDFAGTLDRETFLRFVLTKFGFEDIDEIMKRAAEGEIPEDVAEAIHGILAELEREPRHAA